VFIVGIGYKAKNNFRGDIVFEYRPEYKFRYTEDDKKVKGKKFNYKQNFSSTALRFNAYYDIHNSLFQEFVPYLNAGIGIANNKMNDSITTNNKNNISILYKGKSANVFTWNIGGGAKFALSKSFHLDIGYRYVDLGRFNDRGLKIIEPAHKEKKIGKQKASLKAHEAIFSINYYL
jgi:opacity protein-like surface antigen